MAEHTLTTCDRCRPGPLSLRELMDDGRGWVEGDSERATELGYVRTGEGLVCPDCQDEEGTNA